MHTGRSYRFPEFLKWTRRSLYGLTVVGTIPVAAYELGGQKWLGIPWTAVALLGTATAFIVGFKNTQTYSRTWEARQVWSDIVSGSRGWGVMSKDFVDDARKAREMVDRHLAWLTALRYQMREPRPWETADKPYNKEYQRHYAIPERRIPLEGELAKYLPDAELKQVLAAQNKPAMIASLQSALIKDLYATQKIVVLQFIHLQREIKELLTLQGRSERIKDFPYPRQFATVSRLFVNLFCLFLPLGLLREFDKLGATWLVIPVSVLISWVYTSLDQVGESTENPFEGGANDVPISQMCRAAEIDMLEMIGETQLPPPLKPHDNVLL
jgi:ion channel-forming bestrophin family protein